MNQEARNKGIQAIRKALAEDEQTKIRTLMTKHPKDWIHHLYDDEIAKLTPEQKERGFAGFYASRGHFGFGMAIRNYLRHEGCSEKEMGVDNLDDYYVEMIEEAVKQ